MNNIEQACLYFKEGYNCAQSIIASYSKLFDLDPEIAIKIASGFGGGMARMGNICGAVTGSFMVLGLKYGKIEIDDDGLNELSYERVKNFIEQFKKIHGSITCKDLLNCNINTPEGIEQAREQNLFSDVCPKLVEDSAKILESLL